jgi:hypothetical protein
MGNTELVLSDHKDVIPLDLVEGKYILIIIKQVIFSDYYPKPVATS